MFDKKSDYALNKRKKNAIVYTSTTVQSVEKVQLPLGIFVFIR